ncbi:FHA domain-containing protein, partial [Myxococcota bacterium]|nr:FHA domain-containing protein [Myxococcota bacterium]
MPQRARLLYRTSDGTEQEHVLDPNEREYTIGRHPECTVTVLQQTSVSRRHARILFDGRDYTLEDLKSSNGTYLNNQRIMQTALRQGDSFRCGDLQFEFSLEGEDELLDPIPSPDPEPRRSIRPAGRLPMGAGRLSPQPRPTQMPPGRGAPRRLTPRHFERFESEEGGAYIE